MRATRVSGRISFRSAASGADGLLGPLTVVKHIHERRRFLWLRSEHLSVSISTTTKP